MKIQAQPRYFGPFRRCIYCQFESVRPQDLSKEHVIPKAMFGEERFIKGWNALTLHKASCESCRLQTQDIERQIIRGTMWAVREICNKPSRHAYDLIGLFPSYFPPSFMNGNGMERNEAFHVTSLTTSSGWPSRCRPVVTGKEGGPYTVTLERPDGTTDSSAYLIDNSGLCRLLAKIAHGFAVSWYGLDGFTPLLREIIRGEISDIRDVWQYVGSLGYSHPLRPGHSVYPEVFECRGARYLGVHIKLFAKIPIMPSYFVLAGLLIP